MESIEAGGRDGQRRLDKQIIDFFDIWILVIFLNFRMAVLSAQDKLN